MFAPEKLKIVFDLRSEEGDSACGKRQTIQDEERELLADADLVMSGQCHG